MVIYRYQAIDRAGKKQAGIVEAASDKEAKQRLRDEGLMVVDLTVKKGKWSKENMKGDVLVAFTVQLSQLLNAGIPLYECLQTMEEQYRGEKYHRVLVSLSNQIREGSSLSKAMESFPGTFNRLYCAMVSAGEAVGALNIVLVKLADLLTKQQNLRSQIVTAMIYPGILAGFCFLVIGVLMGFVVPSIEGMFEGKTLNAFTEAVLGLSRFLRGYWAIYVPLIIVTITGTVFYLRTPKGKENWQRLMLKLPFIRRLTIETATARFCRTLGTLQEGGLPLIDSLRIARETMGNVVLEQDIRNAEEKIISGSTLSVELIKTGMMPAMASRMLSAGESSGTMVPMLNRIADMYENELEKTLTRLVTLAQPVILIFMGGLIGVVMVAILLPMSQAATLIQ
jgi:general secretion pathway protein F